MSILQKMVDKFPAFDPRWTNKVKEKWLDSYRLLFDAVQEAEKAAASVPPKDWTEIDAMLIEGWPIKEIAKFRDATRVEIHARYLKLVESGQIVRPKRHPGLPVPSLDEVEPTLRTVLEAVRQMTAEGAKLSYPAIAKRAGIHRSSIRPFIKELEERGEVHVLTQADIGGSLAIDGGVRLGPRPAPSAPCEPIEEISRAGAPTHKERRCLRCEKKFLSEHIGQRMCPTCRVSAGGLPDSFVTAG